MTKKNSAFFKFLIVLLSLFILCCDDSEPPPEPPIPPVPPPPPSKYQIAALKIADYLLGQQNIDGAIPDAPGWDTVNEDSNMEYALIGFAAAYEYSQDGKYLTAMERGINWLAEREEMTDENWRGSWYYAFSATPPYNPVQVSVGPGISNVRGVDATSALFVYLLYLHSKLSGSRSLADKYELNAKAALDFLLSHNISKDGYFYSSWHKWKSDDRWHLWRFCYTADQADVYLGLQAGWLLYGDQVYETPAAKLKEKVCSQFFSVSDGRFALGLEEDGSLCLDFEGFNGTFPQGYLPWVFQQNSENEAAFAWLSLCVQTDGSLICYEGDPGYSLNVALYALAASSLNYPQPDKSLTWILDTTLDPTDGGVRDSSAPNSEKFSNVAGFTIMAMLQFQTQLHN